MCMFCNWGEAYPEDGPDSLTDEALAAAAERRRSSQELWARLMEEIRLADEADESSGD